MKHFIALLALHAGLAFGQNTLRTNDSQQFLNAKAPRNYIINSGYEKNTKSGVTDANTIITRNTVNPIEGQASFEIGTTTSTTYQAEFLAEPLQAGLRGRNCVGEFSYMWDASGYQAWVADNSNNRVSAVVDLKNTEVGSVTPTTRVQMPFPCGPSGGTYKIIIKASGTQASLSFKADSFFLGEWDAVSGEPNITNWNAFTPTIGNGGTTAISTGFWRQVGDSIEIQYFTQYTGAGTSSPLVYSLPGGYVINTSKVGSSGVDTMSFGSGAWFDNGTAEKIISPVYRSNTSFSLVVDGQSSVLNGNAIAHGDWIRFMATVPVNGLSANSNVVRINQPGTTWTSYTPTITYGSGIITNATHYAQYKCIAPDVLALNIVTEFTGTSTAYNTPRYSLPPGAVFSAFRSLNNWVGSTRVEGSLLINGVPTVTTNNEIAPLVFSQSTPNTDVNVSTAAVTNSIAGSSGHKINVNHPGIPIQPGFCPASQAAYVKQGVVYDTQVKAEGVNGVTTVESGTYTPTPVNGTNIAASNAASCFYQRLGAIVNVNCSVPLTCTAGTASTSIVGIPLPVASNLTGASDLNGTFSSDASTTAESGRVRANTANNRAEIAFICNNTASLATRTVQFQYEVK